MGPRHLTRLNPVRFSAANLRAKQGPRAATREVYLGLVEFDHSWCTRLKASNHPDYVKLVHVNGTSELPLKWLGGKESTRHNGHPLQLGRCEGGDLWYGTPRGWCSQLLPSFSEPSPQRKKKRCQR